MKNYCLKLILNLSIILLCFLSFSETVFAQNDTEEDIEVYLSFRHRGVINTVVVAYYKDDTFFLPINELFELFQIDATINGLITTGKFAQEQTLYSINLENKVISFGDTRRTLTDDDFLINDFDNYLTTEIFEDVFGLRFIVDLNNLAVDLETEKELPSIESALRNIRRRFANQNRNENVYHPLRSGRERTLINGGFLDYSLSSFVSEEENNYNINTSLGLQLAGGELQGNVAGYYSDDFSDIRSENLSWRYVIGNTPAITDITIGQSVLDGVLSTPYSGIRITNEPIEPRRFFSEFEVQGFTFPESEVELYLNNALIDFQKTDDSGQYRFLAPQYYGSSLLNVKIYGPTGQIIERASRVRVPFNFLPKGKVNYYVNAGTLDNPVIGSTERSLTVQGNGSIGLTHWLTTKVGLEYFEHVSTSNLPTLTSTVSARILSNYILSLEGVSKGYYRSTLNAIYPNSSSISVDYTNYTTDTGIYNGSGNSSQLIASVFYPLSFFKLPVYARASSFSRLRGESTFTSFRLDLNTRISKLNLRVGYSDRLIDSYNFIEPSNASLIESSASYNLSRNRKIPKLLQGTFFRAQMRYFPSLSQFESSEFLFSKNIFQKGRFQLAFGRNFSTSSNSLRFSLIIDFNKIRSNTTVAMVRNSFTTTQNFRGSIGYDSNYNNFLFTGRDQVGRSGSAVKLFVDNNSNDKIDEDDELIPGGALRIGRNGTSSIEKNGVLYYTQMLPYYQYDMEMNTGSIINPMLVPSEEKFSIIADPNTFKKIEIPFYMSGIIDGIVEKVYSNGRIGGIGGLKLILSSVDKDFSKEIRTFSDGSFYEYEVPPGNYEVFIEPSQLEILESKSFPEKIEFEVKAIPEGDFVEGLGFTLRPTDYIEEEKPDSTVIINTRIITQNILEDQAIIQFENDLSNNVDMSLRYIIMAQNAFYNKDIETAFTYVSESLEMFETAQAYALRGTLYYFRGNREEAIKSWETAVRFDPDINIPNIDTLDDIVNTGTLE